MFGSDGSPIVQYVSIFAVIFAVLTVIVLVVRRLGGGGLAAARGGGTRGRQPRLGIVDVYELDRQRQLILLRRDNVEHLLLVGGPNDVVIERHIQRGQRDPSLRPEAMAEPLPDTVPEPAPFPGLDGRGPEAAFQPFSMPVVLAPAAPGSAAAPPVTRPLDVGALDAGALDAADAGAERPAEAIVTGPRPEAVGRRALRRTTPPPVDPRPDAAPEPPRLAPAPPETTAPSPAIPGGAMPPMPPSERRAVDPAILSDMARQLEAALARPASAVTPPPAARPTPPKAERTATATDPMAAAPAVAPPSRDEKPDDALFEEPAPPAAPPTPAPFLPALPQSKPVEAPLPVPPPPQSAASAPVEAPEPQPRPTAEQARTEPPRAVEAPRDPPPPGPKPAANPFSVEEIEAEFARLLGRPLDKRS
ncbi:hypothetical protein [uncultured Methylobacterium sp.]|uniref:hypothetical protein n=1 Tax=uncultured Methylobacterium sp. TaxID=157278 RepID=UPI0035C9B5E4